MVKTFWDYESQFPENFFAHRFGDEIIHRLLPYIPARGHVLDYGCGPGSYLIPASRLVTDSGKVYALDIQSAALQYVRRIIKKNDLTNVETILSDCATGLPDDSIDVVLLYDIFHDLNNPNEILKEIHRILKPGGILSFNDHHMKDGREILTGITGSGLFILSQKGERVYNFSKVIQGG